MAREPLQVERGRNLNLKAETRRRAHRVVVTPSVNSLSAPFFLISLLSVSVSAAVRLSFLAGRALARLSFSHGVQFSVRRSRALEPATSCPDTC